MNRLAFTLAVAFLVAPALGQDEDYERAPIHYSTATSNDPIAQLKQRIDRGEATLEWTPTFGYLPSLLEHLDIPASCGARLLQRLARTDPPKSPGHYYATRHTSVTCRTALIELAGQDPTLGAVFYTIEQTPPDARGGSDGSRQDGQAEDRPVNPVRIVRENDNCLSCHGSGMTVEVPGLTLRSVFPDERGTAILAGGTKVSTHASPLEKRWGGWYVTGDTGGVRTKANTLFKPSKGLADPTPLEGSGGPLSDLSDRIDTNRYLTPHSDPVALMVMEHQVEAHNRLTHAAQATLRALHDEKVINDALGETRPAGTHNDSTMSRRNAATSRRVPAFSGEAKLPARSSDPPTSPRCSPARPARFEGARCATWT